MDSTTSSGSTTNNNNNAPGPGASNQATQAVATTTTDIKRFEADILKFLQDESILEPIPGSTNVRYRPVGGRRSGLVLILNQTTVDASIERLAAHLVSVGLDAVDKLPENYSTRMGEAFDLCHWGLF